MQPLPCTPEALRELTLPLLTHRAHRAASARDARPALRHAHGRQLVAAIALLCACESTHPKPSIETTSAPYSATSNQAAPGAAKTSAASIAATSTPTNAAAIPRVSDRSQLVLGVGQRQALEAAFPEAKGFLDVIDVEERLYGKGLKHDAVKAAVNALDSVASGKWVLFVGNLIAPSAEGFELAVRYVPREPQDAMGFTSAWLNVRFASVKGYDPKNYKAGDLVAILARYNGKQQATPGYDTVALGKWVFHQ